MRDIDPKPLSRSATAGTLALLIASAGGMIPTAAADESDTDPYVVCVPIQGEQVCISWCGPLNIVTFDAWPTFSDPVLPPHIMVERNYRGSYYGLFINTNNGIDPTYLYAGGADGDCFAMAEPCERPVGALVDAVHATVGGGPLDKLFEAVDGLLGTVNQPSGPCVTVDPERLPHQ